MPATTARTRLTVSPAAGFDSAGSARWWNPDPGKAGTLFLDACQQCPPRDREGVGAFALQARGQGVGVDAFVPERLQHGLRIAAIGRQRRTDLAVIGKGLQRLLGIVLMVSGAARASRYSVSDATGSLVPVLAHSSRCGRAPASARRCQRVDASRSR
jgi:hypothetical protein